MGTPPIRLHDTYYHDNFLYVLAHVERLYASFLTPFETGFLSEFRALSISAQCLYIRMANRKGRFFRPSKLIYAEIKDTATAWQELHKNGFISSPVVNDEWDALDLVRLFTVGELKEVLKSVGVEAKQAKREELVLLLFETFTLPKMRNRLLELEEVVEMAKLEQLEMIRLFFFGHPWGDMSQFVIRDIGNAKFETYDEELFKPQFRSYDEVSQLFDLHQQYRALKKAMLVEDEALIDEAVSALTYVPENLSPVAESIVKKFIMRTGKWYEQNKFLERAAITYSRHSLPESRERLVRVLIGLGKKDDAKEVLQRIAAEPETHSEWLFASDQLVKLSGKKQVLTTTKVMKEAPELIVPKPDGSLNIEEHVLITLREQGFEGAHTENYIWRSLFGLVFWEELYSQERALIHQPLQRVPLDLQDRRYLKSRYQAFEHFLSVFESKQQLQEKVHVTMQAKENIVNPWVGWHSDLAAHMEALFRHLSLEQLKEISLEMARNPLENGTGLPDLFVWNSNDYHFWEVKSPTDHLSAHQVFWINFMKEHGVKVEVLRIVYN
ncbi:MAG: VRR-NUC domain-containing protein [Imperialibacter sp.]|uniref:VRR-NUC domain-containing protein n=1 Tax=Imperialibacter sp. TaxID=2038411 RepID=UPI003A85EAB4